MTQLGREIAETIAAEGPMRLDRYMALALSHPVHGYYATRDPFGARGDFTTAPEISQMFGELVGLWCAEIWRMMGAPARLRLVELGPGRGTLMVDMLRAGKAAPGFLDACEIVLVETSPTLRAIQARTLAAFGDRVWWADTIEDALSARAAVLEGGLPPPAIVVANEFFDALPIRQFVRMEDGWRERLVGLGPDGALAFGLSGEPPADIRLPDAPVGAVREVCPAALDITAQTAAHVAVYGGATLVIDYGYLSGHGDTLQAVRAHGFVDLFDAPGEADLTAHVDFAALGEAARSAGARLMAPLTQRDLLERLGLTARAAALAKARPDLRDTIVAAVARLTDPSATGMGALFKALAFGDPALGPLPGFALAPAKTLERQGSPP